MNEELAKRLCAKGEWISLFCPNFGPCRGKPVRVEDGAIYLDRMDPDDEYSGDRIWVVLSAVVAYRVGRQRVAQ